MEEEMVENVGKTDRDLSCSILHALRSTEKEEEEHVPTEVRKEELLILFLVSETCPQVKNILLLDSEGKRVAVKYYSNDWLTNSAKLAFEKSVFTKIQKTNARTEAEIAMIDSYILIYKSIQDLYFFVTGGDDESEIILATVLEGFIEAVTLLLRENVSKRTTLENLDLIFCCLDEMVDGGIILETEGSIIASKVSSNGLESATTFSEQTLSQALATAREHLTRSILG
ncbi:PREDICTED: coatomer subunit zeta-1-like [Nelumbo nucifera]|uniref:Coatomer subunit zeta n=1 Tax=Nelumbo nucifera TaxID=4432 RepID=A0A1U7Z024_NELNU|nr:PREDICTED: coatomer subunit zeta-1-like [Nelumbo nucifera]